MLLLNLIPGLPKIGNKPMKMPLKTLRCCLLLRIDMKLIKEKQYISPLFFLLTQDPTLTVLNPVDPQSKLHKPDDEPL